MGLFNFIKKKEQEVKDLAVNEIKKQINNMSITNALTGVDFNKIEIHDDIRDLLWIENGPLKNYEQSKTNETRFNIDGYTLTLTFVGDVEPSLINTNLRIRRSGNYNNVNKLPYYPRYSELTEDQRGIFWDMVSNPYNDSIDIGYIFILYYGLERHLLLGNFEKAFNTIIKLRDIHKNNSFQFYSGNALVLSCLYHQRPDMVMKFIKSLDKDHEFSFSNDLFLLCSYSFDIPMRAKDIIRMAKAFEFNNRNYIKEYPELFEEKMVEILIQKYGKDCIDLKSVISKNEFKKLRYQEMRLFANTSLINESIKVPIFTDNFTLKRKMNDLLETTHDQMKIVIAELRKSGELKKKEQKVVTSKVIIFDQIQEKELLKQLRSINNNSVNQHFAYIALQDFYYKYRNVDESYLNLCIDYCLKDIESLKRVDSTYIREEVSRISSLNGFYSKKEVLDQIADIKKNGFRGSIPAFKRLAIIYEKKGLLCEAKAICDKAIDYYNSKNLYEFVEDFTERKMKLQEKERKNGK